MTEVVRFPYGPLQSNMYLMKTEESVYVIDPSVSFDVTDLIADEVTAVIITHGHFDHIYKISEWHEKCPGVPFYMNPKDKPLLEDAVANCAAMVNREWTFDIDTTDIFDLDGKTFTDGGVIRIFETPGHSAGSCCILFEQGEKRVLFSGDTLFAGGLGRTDLVSSSPSDMQKSIEFLKTLPPATEVYPGHGSSTTISAELESNPFFY